jgi:hypothetical protein
VEPWQTHAHGHKVIDVGAGKTFWKWTFLRKGLRLVSDFFVFIRNIGKKPMSEWRMPKLNA